MGDIVQSRAAHVGSEDWARGFLFRVKYHFKVFHHAETWIHMRCCGLLLEKITMSLVNPRVSTMDGVVEHPDRDGLENRIIPRKQPPLHQDRHPSGDNSPSCS